MRIDGNGMGQPFTLYAGNQKVKVYIILYNGGCENGSFLDPKENGYIFSTKEKAEDHIKTQPDYLIKYYEIMEYEIK